MRQHARMSGPVVAMLALGLVIACGSPANAVTTWTGGIGNWDEDAKWDSGLEPGAGDPAVINDSSAEVTLNLGGEVAQTLNIGTTAGGGGELIVQPGGSLLIGGGTAGDSSVGFVGPGSLTQHGGSIEAWIWNIGNSGVSANGVQTMHGGTFDVNDILVFGRNANADGTFTQDGGQVTVGRNMVVGDKVGSVSEYNLSGGAANTLDVTQALIVGSAGKGTFNQSGGVVTPGTLVLAAGSGEGTYNLSGGSLNPGAQYTDVGVSGKGTFNHSGGTFNFDRLRVAVNSGASGSSYNTSGSAVASGNNFWLGWNDDAELVMNGGTIEVAGGSAGSFKAGVLAGGEATMTINDGLLHANGLAVIGQLDDVTVNQYGGTFKVDGQFQMSTGAGFNTEYNLYGGVLDGASLGYVGYVANSNATVNQYGGHAEFANYFTLANGAGSTGNYNMHGGTLFLSSNLTPGRYGGIGTFFQDGGTVTVNGSIWSGSDNSTYTLDGGTLNVLNTFRPYNGISVFNFNFTGGVFNANTVQYDVVNQGGTLSPGGNGVIGSTTFNSGYGYTQNAGGTLRIDVASLASFDVLNMGTEQLNLAGDLEVVLLGGYSPAQLDEFQVLNLDNFGGQLTGTFDFVTHGWKDSRLYTEGVLVYFIPEPTTITLLGLGGLACLLACTRRRRTE